MIWLLYDWNTHDDHVSWWRPRVTNSASRNDLEPACDKAPSSEFGSKQLLWRNHKNRNSWELRQVVSPLPLHRLYNRTPEFLPNMPGLSSLVGFSCPSKRPKPHKTSKNWAGWSKRLFLKSHLFLRTFLELMIAHYNFARKRFKPNLIIISLKPIFSLKSKPKQSPPSPPTTPSKPRLFRPSTVQAAISSVQRSSLCQRLELG